MPLVDVTVGPELSVDVTRRLVRMLPHAVSVAVECAEEPYDGDLRPGDVLVRVRESGPLDRFDIDVLIEVKSKWFEDRARNREDRAESILDAVHEEIGDDVAVGVYLTLPPAAWAQSE